MGLFFTSGTDRPEREHSKAKALCFSLGKRDMRGFQYSLQ